MSAITWKYDIRNPHTRRAYGRAVGAFLTWCEEQGVRSIAAVQPLHVAAWIELQTREIAAPSVKQQLAAIRHLFDWLVTGHVVEVNPAASVRGPSHVVRQGKTPVLEPAEARTLLDSIDVTTPAGLRDRALIAVMVFSFARIGAALAMKVEDVFVQNRRLWVRLREKGGKPHAMPCHHTLEAYLTAYLEETGIMDEPARQAAVSATVDLWRHRAAAGEMPRAEPAGKHLADRMFVAGEDDRFTIAARVARRVAPGLTQGDRSCSQITRFSWGSIRPS